MGVADCGRGVVQGMTAQTAGFLPDVPAEVDVSAVDVSDHAVPDVITELLPHEPELKFQIAAHVVHGFCHDYRDRDHYVFVMTLLA